MNSLSKTTDAAKIIQTGITEYNFPYRYETSSAKTDTNPFLCLNPFLNRYVLPGDCICTGQDAYAFLRSFLDDGLFSLLSSTPSFSDCIRLLSYALGILSSGDLKYYLGIDAMFLRSLLAATEKSYHNLIRYKLRKNYNSYHYYLYKPDSYPFRNWSKIFPSPAGYAKRAISLRSIPHSYSVSLSILMMGLWCAHSPAHYLEYHLETSLGNYEYAPGKSSAEITMDALCLLRDCKSKVPQAFICLEQDMGSENYSILLTKLYNYSQTSYFSGSAAQNTYILFSCNRLLAARASRPMYEKKWHVALYILFRQLLSMQHGNRKLYDANIFPVLPSLRKYLENLLKRGKAVTAKTIFESCTFPELNQNTLFGVPLQDVIQCVLSLTDKIPDIFNQFLAAIGRTSSTLIDPFAIDAPICRMPLPLRAYRLFIQLYPQDDDYLTRLSYNVSLYDIAHSRHYGLAHAILSVMRHKRAIKTRIDTVDQNNSVVFLHPIYQGYSIYTVATPLLSNYMPYLLWNRASEEIISIENAVSAYFPRGTGALSYSPLSPEIDIGYGESATNGIESAYFPKGRFRHYYTSLQFKDGSPFPHQFCIEDLDADVGAYCRAYLFLRHYRSIENLQLIMLVDSPGSALTFYQNVVWRKTYGTFTQSPECRVPLYAQNNFVGRFLSWQIPQLLFLERGNSLYSDKRLFGISENGYIVYYR